MTPTTATAAVTPTAAGRPITNPDTPNEPNGLESDGTVSFPLNLRRWVEENRHLFKPPVGNKYLYSGKDFFVMMIVGPNARNDFHQTDSEEFFFQLKGDVSVKLIQGGRVVEYPIREGDVFFIPPGVPHSPQRGPDTVGLVVERRRPPGEKEHLIFFCEDCNTLVYDKVFDCKDIVNHFARAMEEFWADPALSTCKGCGHRITKPVPKVAAPKGGCGPGCGCG
jgi:3-hydroxyanthranilate 3,4-dioxygenase